MHGSTRRGALLLLALGATLLAAGCQDGEVANVVPPLSFDHYVSAATGDDTNPGTFSAPFRTITQALSVVASSEAVKVFPGTYDAAHGEVFPLVLPAGAKLVGDEANKGQGSPATEISGGALLAGSPQSGVATAIDARDGSLVAGFVITNAQGSSGDMGLAPIYPGVTVRNNSILNSSGNGMFVMTGGDNLVIRGNRFSGNGTAGLYFRSGGVGSRVENNVIVANTSLGIGYDAAGGDLGGGTAGSAGGNVLSCNPTADIWTASAITINAAGNLWDHVPPTLDTVSSGGGIDIFNSNGNATVNLGTTALAPSPCP